ncbi:MAG: hypothetical protein GY699_04925, partial [Desulfobacteraceae bacterium]|nr:hypothetical protein [Desulfobacteraceae bacterium]
MQFKKVLSVFIGIILGLSICLLMIFINLPNIVESQAEKRLPQFLNSAEVDFHIQKLGLYNTFVSKLRFGKGLTIDFINIDYGINGLSSLNIDTITLSGLKIIASIDKNNQIKIQGLELPKSEKSKTFKIENPFLAWLPKKIILKNSKIILHKGSQEFVIPFDILSSLKLNDDKVVAQILFHPFGENISAKVTYDMNKGIEGVAIEGKSFDVGHINQMIPKNIDGFNVNDFVDFKLESSAPLKKWKIWVSNIDMEKPLKTTINDLNAMMLIQQKKINVDGSFNLIHQPIPAVQMKYGLILDLEKDIFFDLNFSNDKMDDFKLTHESKSAKLKNLKILATFQGTPEKSNGKVDIKLDGGQIQYEKESLHFSNTQILTDISADFSEEGKGIGSKFNIISKNIQTKSNGINASFPLASISGQCQVDKKYTLKGFMTLNASKGKISSAKFKTHASDISVEIPVQYPTPKKELIGKYSIPSISYDKQYHLSAKGKIRQRKLLEFLVDGRVSFKSLPAMEPIFNSVVGFKNGVHANVDFETNSFNV